jgi:steroid 5-alpha reductase family enzyme
MNSFLETLGFDTGSPAGIFVFCCVFTFVVVTVIWLIGLFQPTHSMMDAWYGFAYAVPAWFAFYLGTGAHSQVAALVLLMVTLHGGRLGYYLCARWRRFTKTLGGDPRYIGFAEQFSPGYWWKSFFRVMEPQAVLIVVAGCPAVWGILAARDSTEQPGPLSALGFLVFGVGLYFETAADAQLQAFLADKPHNRGRYLNTGVWTHSRHPNYFGTTTVWWGIWLVAVDGDTSAWWTVIGPVVNTLLLTVIAGARFQDSIMGTRPEYRKLMARTRAFLPLPVSAPTGAVTGGQDANEPDPAGERLRRE